jgi:hypothetical protein
LRLLEGVRTQYRFPLARENIFVRLRNVQLAELKIFPPPALLVSPATPIAASGIQGQVSATFPYVLSASGGSVSFSISGLPTSPAWLTAQFTTGTVGPNANPPMLTDNFTVNDCGLSPGLYSATIAFTNTNTGQGNTTVAATLTVNPGTIASCKNGGWEKYLFCAPGPFKNQGACVTFFGGT